jgi:hypothetical protein
MQDLKKQGMLNEEQQADIDTAVDAIQEVLSRANAAVDKEHRAAAVIELHQRVDDWKGIKRESFGELLLFGNFTVLKGDGGKDTEREVREFFDELHPDVKAMFRLVTVKVPALQVAGLNSRAFTRRKRIGVRKKQWPMTPRRSGFKGAVQSATRSVSRMSRGLGRLFSSERRDSIPQFALDLEGCTTPSRSRRSSFSSTIAGMFRRRKSLGPAEPSPPIPITPTGKGLTKKSSFASFLRLKPSSEFGGPTSVLMPIEAGPEEDVSREIRKTPSKLFKSMKSVEEVRFGAPTANGLFSPLPTGLIMTDRTPPTPPHRGSLLLPPSPHTPFHNYDPPTPRTSGHSQMFPRTGHFVNTPDPNVEYLRTPSRRHVHESRFVYPEGEATPSRRNLHESGFVYPEYEIAPIRQYGYESGFVYPEDDGETTPPAGSPTPSFAQSAFVEQKSNANAQVDGSNDDVRTGRQKSRGGFSRFKEKLKRSLSRAPHSRKPNDDVPVARSRSQSRVNHFAEKLKRSSSRASTVHHNNFHHDDSDDGMTVVPRRRSQGRDDATVVPDLDDRTVVPRHRSQSRLSRVKEKFIRSSHAVGGAGSLEGVKSARPRRGSLVSVISDKLKFRERVNSFKKFTSTAISAFKSLAAPLLAMKTPPEHLKILRRGRKTRYKLSEFIHTYLFDGPFSQQNRFLSTTSVPMTRSPKKDHWKYLEAFEKQEANLSGLSRPYVEQYSIYLFERILLCCKDVNPTKQRPSVMGRNKEKPLANTKGKPKLQLKGRIFMANVTEIVSLSKLGMLTLSKLYSSITS